MAEIEKTISVGNDVITYKVSYHNDRISKSESQTINKNVVLLLHGLASNLTRWTEFVMNTSLKNNVDLLRLDLRGHGKSMCFSRISIQDWCNDIYQILNEEKYSKVIIVGHSLGAQIAMQFAFYYPRCTKGIVLIDPVFPTALKGILGIVRRFRYGVLILIYLLLMKSKMGFTNKSFPYRDLHDLDIKTREILNSKTDSDIAKLYMNPFEDLIYIPFVNYCQDAFEVTRKVPNLGQINCAVLCLLSKGAAVSNLEVTKSFVNQFPFSEIEIIDADHWLLTEKPVESRQVIEKWCTAIL